MATMMHLNSRVIDMITHRRLLDGVAVMDDANSFIPNSGYNLQERHYIGSQSIMDGGVLIRGPRLSPQHNTNSEYSYPRERHYRANSSNVGQNAMNQNHRSRLAPRRSSIYRSQQEIPAPGAVRRPGNLTQLRHLHPEGDMRLGIEDASYEELLALGERIGNVSTGLSERAIASKLRTRTYSLSSKSNNLEAELCIICQEEYNDQETICSLSCGHEYHADCLKKWLVLKNECPMCRSRGLTLD